MDTIGKAEAMLLGLILQPGVIGTGVSSSRLDGMATPELKGKRQRKHTVDGLSG